MRASDDAAAQLMELGQAETFASFDDDDGGVRNVDADFDDGCGAEDMRRARFEIEHGFFLFGRFHFAMEDADFIFRKDAGFQALRFFDDGFGVDGIFFRRIAFINAWTDNICLAAGDEFLADFFVGRFAFVWRDNFCHDRFSSGRHLIEESEVEVAIHGESERPRDGCGGHGEEVGDGFFQFPFGFFVIYFIFASAFIFFAHELGALVRSEAVLFVDDGQGEIFEFD